MGGAILPVVPTIEQSEILEQDVKNLNDADDAVTAVMEKAELERAVHRSDREMLVLAANRHACPEQANYGEDQTAWSDTQTANAQTIAIKALQQKANAEQALRRMHRRVNRLNHDKAMVRSKARTALRRHGLRHFEEKMRQVLADIQQTNLDIESIKRSQKQAVNAYRTTARLADLAPSNGTAGAAGNTSHGSTCMQRVTTQEDQDFIEVHKHLYNQNQQLRRRPLEYDKNFNEWKADNAHELGHLSAKELQDRWAQVDVKWTRDFIKYLNREEKDFIALRDSLLRKGADPDPNRESSFNLFHPSVIGDDLPEFAGTHPGDGRSGSMQGMAAWLATTRYDRALRVGGWLLRVDENQINNGSISVDNAVMWEHQEDNDSVEPWEDCLYAVRLPRKKARADGYCTDNVL